LIECAKAAAKPGLFSHCLDYYLFNIAYSEYLLDYSLYYFDKYILINICAY